MFSPSCTAFLALALALLRLVSAQDPITANRELHLVRAGKAPFETISVLRKKADADGVVEVCPANFPKGISIRCGGTKVNAPERMSINDLRVQTETREPYHIAGDFDNGGLTEILPWDGYLEKQRCAKGKKCNVKVKCDCRDNNGNHKSFSRPLTILADGFEGDPAVGLVLCDIDSLLMATFTLKSGAILPFVPFSRNLFDLQSEMP